MSVKSLGKAAGGLFCACAMLCGAAWGAARVVTDVAYDPSIGASGLGNLYLPDVVTAKTPVVLVIHGGGWTGLDRASTAGIAEFFQRELGFAAFNIEYRLAGASARWPACGDDCVKAGQFLLSSAFKSAYGLCHDKIWICGGSAGGHLTLWTLVKMQPSQVAGAISISSIGDPEPDCVANPGRYTPLFGHAPTISDLATMNPIPSIQSGCAPLLCTHADVDAVVPIASHRAFADAYRAAGNVCDFFMYASTCEPNEGGHFIWRTGSSPHKLLDVLEQRIRGFVQGVQGASGATEATHNSFTRRLTTNANARVEGVYNQGTLRKTAPGDLTLVAPGLGGAGTLAVEQGRVEVDLRSVPAVPALPASLVDKFKLWLDASKNVVSTDTSTLDWYDCREPDVNADSLVYPYASSRFKYMEKDYYGSTIGAILPPNPVSNLTARPYLDFGEYATTLTGNGRGLSITNTGVAKGEIRARELFVVCRKRNTGLSWRGTMFSWTTGGMQQPCWGGGGDGYIWGSSVNTRADKGDARLDREPVTAAKIPIDAGDNDWHLLVTRLPNPDGHCTINQIGIDRTIAKGGMFIGEVIVCETRLSDLDRMRVEDYLWKKWFGGRAKTLGTLEVNTNATVVVDTPQAVRGALAGGGTVVVKGGGQVTLENHGFTGLVQLEQGADVAADDLALAVTNPVQKLTVYDAGHVLAEPSPENGVWLSGNGRTTVGWFPPAVENLYFTGNGTFRLSPPARTASGTAANVLNHDMEAWANQNKGADIVNYAGGSGQCATNQNWIFDRSMWSSGNNLVTVMYTNSYLHSPWTTQTRPDLGLGWEGRAWLYVCWGRITGTFTVPANGYYALQCRVSSRGARAHAEVILGIDGTPVRTFTSFDWTQFLRYGADLPYLTAGTHTVSFEIEKVVDPSPTFTVDDVQILPRHLSAEPLAEVAIANPSFEEPISNLGTPSYNIGDVQNFIPASANLTGWTVTGPTAPSQTLLQKWIRRRWFEGVRDTSWGMIMMPEEMPDGFLAARVVGNARYEQTVDFPSAGRYRLTFWAAHGVGYATQLLRAFVGDAVVRQDLVCQNEFKKYEADFDVAEAGPRVLAFQGDVGMNASNPYVTGEAYLDAVSIRRIGDMRPANLVRNGTFERVVDGAYEEVTEGWTFAGAATTISNSGMPWVHDLKISAPEGRAAACLYGTDGALRRQIDFPAAGRYELSFLVRQVRRYPRTHDIYHFRVGVGSIADATNTIYHAQFLDNPDVRRITIPFTVDAPATRVLEFYAHTPGRDCGYVLVDDVEIHAAPCADRADLGDFIPETTTVRCSATSRLLLDFDGRAKVRDFVLSGKKIYGEISHATHPTTICGRGRLYVSPRGTAIFAR